MAAGDDLTTWESKEYLAMDGLAGDLWTAEPDCRKYNAVHTHEKWRLAVMRRPEQVPEALRGTRPRWWSSDRPVLAYGPFLVEYSPSAAIVGFLLRQDEHDIGAWCYSDGERTRRLVRTGEPVVKERGIAVPTIQGAVLIRPLRPDDERWVTLYDLPDEDDGDLAARVRKARNW